MPAFFTFTDDLHAEINRQAADARGEPWPHLVLTVRPHHVRGFTVGGDRAYDMDLHHDRARYAVQRIRAYCHTNHCTAQVTVYAPNGEKFCEVEIIRRDPTR